MAILIDERTKVLVQGITGREGGFHAQQMIAYGTKVVAGVTPGKGGTLFGGNVPVFDTVEEAVNATGANASVIFVPAPFAKDAALESIEADLPLTVVITEHIPTYDAWRFISHAGRKGKRVIGPNCPGLISPERSKVGIMPGSVFERGVVGVVSRSGTLTYEIAYQLTKAGLGQSTVIGIGGDPIIGTGFVDALELFNKDRVTRAVVLIGEIGGNDEEMAADYISKEVRKPVVAYIAGRTAPPGKRMGHAGAIVSGSEGTVAAKAESFKAAGVQVAVTPDEVPRLVASSLKKISA